MRSKGADGKTQAREQGRGKKQREQDMVKITEPRAKNKEKKERSEESK